MFFKKFQGNSDMHLDFKKLLQVFLLDPSFGDIEFYYFSIFIIAIVKDAYQFSQSIVRQKK